ncbi:MAG: amino acid transporter, partial [Myxococcales bacterium]|nr:amino acid transporter [Myxococcales bacterium]
MARDGLLPPAVQALSGRRVPYRCVIGTVAAVVLVVALLDAVKIAKLASAFLHLLFLLLSMAVLVMRESRIPSYDPGFRSPGYPWMQVAGIVLPVFFIADMGWLTGLFTTGVVLLGVWWYFRYARGRVERSGAIYHVFHRIGQYRFEPLDTEFRVILREKGTRKDDPFEAVVSQARFLDVEGDVPFLAVVARAAELLEGRVPGEPAEIVAGFLEGTAAGATPAVKGVALP